MVFSTQFDARDRIISNAGSRIKQLYEARVDNQGHIDLVESGTEDLYDYIQSFKESCDINTIVKRFAAGDTDVLARLTISHRINVFNHFHFPLFLHHKP
jgi:hypothetical protein